MISAAKHWCKDEGFFKKTFVLEIMFEYNCSEMCSSCQGPDVKSRLIMTVTELRRKFWRSQKAIVRDFEKIVSPQSEGLRTRTFMFARAWGRSPNKHETTHFRRSGNVWFLHFVYTNALLAPLQNIEFCKDHFTNQTCFVGGDSGPCSIMLIHLSNVLFFRTMRERT